ncbi:MAG: HAD family hydrolase [Acidimicrobiales bacterium]
MPSLTTVEWERYQAVLFDLDGVITPTAEIHERAWGELFADYGYTSQDYLTHIDGKPRYEGVRAFLVSRDIHLPWGGPDDAPGDGTVCALGNRKDELFNAILARDRIAPYPGTIAVMDTLDRMGIPQAVVSSSRNARPVLAAAGLAGRFEVVVDGVTAAQEELAGKPSPEMFEFAARLLDVPTPGSVVVEDAVAGVSAGAAGDFGLVLGVDRGGNHDALVKAGADLVIDDLGETLGAPARSTGGES